jgi:phage terminase small subunit
MQSKTRQPDSVRGIREGYKLDKPEQVSPPKWLSTRAKREFKIIVASLIEAEVPIKQLDCYSIAMAAQCLSSVASLMELEDQATDIKDKLKCAQLMARHQCDLQKWLTAICATPIARARIGLHSSDKKDGPLATLLKLKQNNG